MTESTLYRAALYLYPPAFRREFAAEMMLDFDEARQDARGFGEAGRLWAFRVEIYGDLARSVVLQWVHTRLPVIAVIAIAAPLVVLSGLVQFLPATSVTPSFEGADGDLIGLELLVAGVLFIIATTIVFVSWHMRRFMRRMPARRRW